MHFEYYQLFQLIALITAFVCRKGLQRYRLRMYIPLLLLTNLVELVGNNYELFGWKDNYIIYNLYLLLSTPLWLILFSAMLGLRGLIRKVFYLLSMLIMSLLLLNFLFIQGIGVFNTYSFILLMLLTIAFSCLILISMATTGDFRLPFFRHPYFWINASNLLFSLVSLVPLGLQQYVIAGRAEDNVRHLYYAILPSVNIVLYIGITYGFLLCRKTPNSS